MNQSNNNKKRKLHMPVSYNHSCKGEYMPIAEIMTITPENALKREAMKGQETRD